jgi:hypothetical protein
MRTGLQSCSVTVNVSKSHLAPRQLELNFKKGANNHATIHPSGSAHQPISPSAHQPISPLRLIVTDVDGTLLDSRQQLSHPVVEAVKHAAASGVPLVVATGKARGPWVKDVFPRLDMKTPGVFLQVSSWISQVPDIQLRGVQKIFQITCII